MYKRKLQTDLMNIENYKILISNLPVRQQCFNTKRSTWKSAEKIEWLLELNNKLFATNEKLNISRQDIFDSNGSIREMILKTIYWGYTGGMRGNHFVNIMGNMFLLESTLKEYQAKSSLSGKDFQELEKVFKNIPGLGLSTYSKLLYFLGIRFNQNPCLILDQRLIDVFASKFYCDFKILEGINDYNKENKYLDYLQVINDLSQKLNTEGENIELFLFIFGNNLKITE